MSKTKLSVASMAGICLVISFNAHAINKEYARKLERSGCTQVTELQGCDINKTKAENAKAGFGGPTAAKPSPSPLFKDLAGTNSIGAIDTMTERGFKMSIQHRLATPSTGSSIIRAANFASSSPWQTARLSPQTISKLTPSAVNEAPLVAEGSA